MTLNPSGFLATPTSATAPAVLVLHAWWGLNATIRSFCQRLADAGFVAFAPDLYRGQVADTIPAAEALGAALDKESARARADIVAAARFLTERGAGPIGNPATNSSTNPALAVIGFSLGAYYALDLAATHPALVSRGVLFYGTGSDDVSRSRAAWLGHFAANDPYEPPENVEALEAALRQTGRPVTFHRYPGTGHWFFEPDRAEAYDATAAALAWDRTLDFLQGAGE
jgi:carboxymethylenebutenolidase